MPPGTAARRAARRRGGGAANSTAQAGAERMDIGAAAGSEASAANEHGLSKGVSELPRKGSKPRRKRRRASRRTRRWCRTRQIRRRRSTSKGARANSGPDRPPARAVGPRRGVFRLQPQRDHARGARRAQRRFRLARNHPARAAVSGGHPAPGREGGPRSRTSSGGLPTRASEAGRSGPATDDANGATNMGQTRSASVGRVSMQKNGPPAMARAVVDEGGTERAHEAERRGSLPAHADDDEGEGGDDRMDERE